MTQDKLCCPLLVSAEIATELRNGDIEFLDLASQIDTSQPVDLLLCNQQK